MMGRGQVVRHRFLVAVFAGSNPAAPAILKGFLREALFAFYPSDCAKYKIMGCYNLIHKKSGGIKCIEKYLEYYMQSFLHYY